MAKAKQDREDQVIYLRLPKWLLEAIDKSAERMRRKRTAEIQLTLEEKYKATA